MVFENRVNESEKGCFVNRKLQIVKSFLLYELLLVLVSCFCICHSRHLIASVEREEKRRRERGCAGGPARPQRRPLTLKFLLPSCPNPILRLAPLLLETSKAGCTNGPELRFFSSSIDANQSKLSLFFISSNKKRTFLLFKLYISWYKFLIKLFNIILHILLKVWLKNNLSELLRKANKCKYRTWYYLYKI